MNNTYQEKLTSADDAVLSIKHNSTVAVAMAVGQPPALLTALGSAIESDKLKDLSIYYKISMQPLTDALLKKSVAEKASLHTFFVAGGDRALIKESLGQERKLLSFVPCHFSQLPKVLTEIIGVDTFLVTVAPMDDEGYFNLGTNNDYASVAAKRCKNLIVEVNENMPRVGGDSKIHISEVDHIIENTVPLATTGEAVITPEQEAIAKQIAPLVPNGTTLQIGIGSIADAVTDQLLKHKNLGIHTELLSPALVKLAKHGVVNGSEKTLHPRKIVYTVAMGDPDFYDFLNNNPDVESYNSAYVNNPSVIAQHDNFISINSAIEMDLYGQINAEFLNDHEFSGSGGHLDFIRGSFYSKGGKSIIAMTATAAHGKASRIVPRVQMVTSTRMDVDYVVTEYGVAHLRGKSTKERADAMIAISHPGFRDALTEYANSVNLI